MRIKLQNPYTAQTLELDLPEGSNVRELAAKVTTELNLEQAPQFFSYFLPEKAKELSERTIVEGEKVMLPDDLTIQEVVSSLRDPALPIYFQSQEIDEEELFRFRTHRMGRVGYDIGILNSKKVMLAGVGLLGNEIAQNLAVLGIGKLYLLDYGFVDWYNIYRQPLFSKEDVYQGKVDVVAKKLEGMGKISAEPLRIEIPCLSTELDKDSIFQSLDVINSCMSESDAVIGALDIFSGRGVLQILARYNEKPYISSSVDGWGGKASIYFPDENGCYCCPYVPGQFMDGGACTLATIEAKKIVVGMTIKLVADCLLGNGFPYNEFRYHSRNMQLEQKLIGGSPECSVCGENGLRANDKKEVFDFIHGWLFRRE